MTVEFEIREVDLTRIETFLSRLPVDVPTRILEDIGTGVYARWQAAANERLLTSKADYKKSLFPPEATGDGGITIALRDVFPNLVENGMDAYDMHSSLLPGKKGVHMDPVTGTLWRNVKFRHTGPATGHTVGTPMGFQFIVQKGNYRAKQLGSRVYRQATKLGKDGRTRRMKEGLAPLLQDKFGHNRNHATDIFAGMARITKDGTASGPTADFRTWRRMQKPGTGGKWFHPGIRAKRLLDVVLNDLDDIANKTVDGYIEGILFYHNRGSGG